MSLRPTGSLGRVDPVGSRRRPRPDLHRLGAALALLLAVLLPAHRGHAASGDVLFTDNFESGFGKWSTTSTSLSGINTMTSSSPSRSLFVRGAAVTTTSIAIDTRVPALRVRAWIRRGSDAFSEQPDSGEDLVLEYLDSAGSWVSLGSWPGSGTAGAILSLDQTLGGAALHSAFRLRARLVRGSGGPPDNRGIGWDYWHLDDVVVSEATPSTGLALGRCEEFSGGLANWTVATGYGRADTNGLAVNTPSQSLALHGGTVTVTSQIVDLGSVKDATLRFWLRRGADSFSEDPDTGEDFYVEYLNPGGQWKRLASYAGDGTPGEIVQPSFSLVGAARHKGFRLRFGMNGRDGPAYDYWHVDSVCLSTQSAKADWRFEEGSWTRTNAEVKDSSGNGFNARSEGDATTAFLDAAIDGDPGTCRHGTFDGNGDGVFLGTGTGIDQSAAATYTAWMQPLTSSGARHVMGMNTDPSVSNRSQMSLYAQDGVLYGRATTKAGNYSVKATMPALKTWTHVALAFDGKSLVLYQNATAVASTTFSDTTLVANNREFGIGNVPETRSASFQGYLDEARVYAEALDATRIASVMKETHDCATTSVHFMISHDGSAANCQPESIRVRVLDPLGNVVTTYGGTITITTQSGAGSWSLVDGEGVLNDGTANDGVATYAFDPADLGDVTFALTYASGPSPIDIDVYDAAGRDTDTEGLLSFSPSSFVLTANAVPSPTPATINDPLTTITAGATVPLYISAFGGSSGGASCGVVDTYDGSKNLRFWVDALDPTAPPLVPTVDKLAIARTEATSTSQVVRFTKGRASVSVQYKDTGRLALRVLDSTVSPQVRGATASFVSVPADLKIVAVTNASGMANPGSSTPTGKLFARAGDSFSVTVDAVDAAGDLTPSFGRESVPETIRLRSSTLVAPDTGRNGTTDEGTIDNGTAFTADARAGRFVGTTFAFDEVGAIRLQASVADGDFLGTGPFLGSESGVVGRFAPHHFTVTANAPRFATGCSVGAFTWMGQPFGFAPGFEAELIVTAVGSDGETTANYVDDWMRLSNATLSGRRYRVGGGSVDESGLPATTVDPTITTRNDGSAILDFSTGNGISLVRGAPAAPFDAEVELSIDVLDADATAYPSNPFRVGGTTTGAGIAFDVAKRFQYGRLRLDNAFGSELVTLPMRLRTQRFDGTAFGDDDADSCSRIPSTALVLSPSPSSLSAKPTIANLPLFAGNAGLTFAAPRATGQLDVRVDLGSTGANLPWLRADWPDDGNLDGALDDDPRGRATFGIWEGRDALIFQRELY
ncbi:MAG: LamG domain-containing protein [Myxococcota bacterium]